MAYTYNELAARLAALQVGGTELLSAVQFDATFGPDGTLEARKFAAMHFAEKHACRVVFIGRAEVFCSSPGYLNGVNAISIRRERRLQ